MEKAIKYFEDNIEGTLSKNNIGKVIQGFADQEFESRVNAVTDEIIDANTERLIRDGASDNYILGRIRGAKWFKEQLLKQ